MKVLKKIFTAIGHFFRNIWRYIMTNAWIQPILIVALIFAIIFGLTGIPKLVDTVKGWFDDTADSKIKTKYRKVIDYDDFMEKYNSNEKFVVVFGADDCSNCKSLYSTINKYMDDEEHRNLVGDKIYFFDVTKLQEKIDNDLEKYGDGQEFDEKSEAFKQLDTLSNILYNGYDEILSENYNDSKYADSQKEYGKYSSTWDIQTPTTCFFTSDKTDGATNSLMFNMIVGTWEYKNGYTDINELFACWHLSASDEEKALEKAIDRRETLWLNYQGTK